MIAWVAFGFAVFDLLLWVVALLVAIKLVRGAKPYLEMMGAMGIRMPPTSRTHPTRAHVVKDVKEGEA